MGRGGGKKDGSPEGTRDNLLQGPRGTRRQCRGVTPFGMLLSCVKPAYPFPGLVRKEREGRKRLVWGQELTNCPQLTTSLPRSSKLVHLATNPV